MARRRSPEQKALERIEKAARTGATELHLSNLGLTTLPDSLAQLHNLQVLFVNDNRLTALPDSLAQLRNLQTLFLNHNRLTVLSVSLTQLRNLQKLYVNDNRLTALPDSLGLLQNLLTLVARNNQLTALPDSLGQLQNLQKLYVNDNRLTALPDSLGLLQNLLTLVARNNQLTALPDSLGQLQNLQLLDVADNQLTALPDSLGQLQNLQLLDVADNQLTALPDSLGQLQNLEKLDVSGNPLPDPYPELIKRGTKAVLTYLRSLAKEEKTEPQYEAKLILVGEGSVGKTCLVRALQAGPGLEKKAFDPDSKTTHGIKIGQVVLPHPDEPGTSMTLNAWDFGGQEVYRITHQFFFSRRALYLLVWRPREGQEAGQLEFWLKSIRLRAPDAKVVLVSTYADEGRHPEVDFDDLKRRYGEMIVGGCHEVSNAEGTGFSPLRETIRREAARLEHMGRRYNKRWLAARDDALAHPEPRITREVFDGIAKKHELTDDAAEVWLNLLHDLGRIVYYGDDEGLRDMIVIKPQWLTEAISYVLEDKPTRDHGGFLEHARLPKIWKQYRSEHYPFFLRLMEKFDISYRDSERQASLVGQLVPYVRPALPWELPTPIQSGFQEISLVCDMSDDPPGLVEWLTVRNHPYRTEDGTHWRNGVFLRHRRGEALFERAGRQLQLSVRSQRPIGFFEILRDGLLTLIEARWPGLEFQLKAPCRGMRDDEQPCDYLFAIDDLERKRNKGKTRTECPRCDSEQRVLKLLHGFDVSSSVEDLAAKVDDISRALRALHRSQAAENKEHPSVFTLIPSGGGIIHDKWELTLWCQHPGHEHAVEEAIYEVPEPKEWVVRLSPAIKLLGQMLRLAVGVADFSGLSQSVVELTKKQADGMQKILKELPADDRRLDDHMRDEGGRLTPAQGAAFRQLRSLLREVDPAEGWGRLRRFQTNEGDWLWICPVHSTLQQYDPGYPVLPGAAGNES